MTAGDIAAGLAGKRSGAGTWMARCPAHKDRTPSLAIRERDGRILVHCHAGCDQRDVVAALRDLGLWSESESKWREWRDGIRYPTDWGIPVCEYRYTDESGAHRYSVVRFTPKSFRQGYPANGRWLWKKHPQQVLYRLPEVLEAPIVFLPEGEKDCEALRDYGFVATTNAGGAEAPWLPQFTEGLRGREVILLPDADLAGRRRVVRIARALLGVAARIVVLELPGAKDAAEWFERGHSELELIALTEGQAVNQ